MPDNPPAQTLPPQSSSSFVSHQQTQSAPPPITNVTAAQQPLPDSVQINPQTQTPETTPFTLQTQTSGTSHSEPQQAQAASLASANTQAAPTALPAANHLPDAPQTTAPPFLLTEPRAELSGEHRTPETLPPATGAPPEGFAPQKPSQPLQNPNAAPPPLFFRLLGSAPADIDRYLNNLRDITSQIRRELTQAPELRVSNPDLPAARVLQEARILSDIVDFTAQIRNQLYVQLPLYHNGLETQATLHIYKDAKKIADGKKDTATALVALDTASLGRFETYIQKNDNAVHLCFRLDNLAVEQTVRDAIDQLEALLRNHNFSLAGFSFAKPGKPYTLLDSPVLFDEASHIKTPAEPLPRFDKMA
jgi:hypothetical protein